MRWPCASTCEMRQRCRKGPRLWDLPTTRGLRPSRKGTWRTRCQVHRTVLLALLQARSMQRRTGPSGCYLVFSFSFAPNVRITFQNGRAHFGKVHSFVRILVVVFQNGSHSCVREHYCVSHQAERQIHDRDENQGSRWSTTSMPNACRVLSNPAEYRMTVVCFAWVCDKRLDCAATGNTGRCE